MANPHPQSTPAPSGADPAQEEPAVPAAGSAVPCDLGAGYDHDLKRQVRLQLPDEFPVDEDEIELFSRLFGDIVDRVLTPKEPLQ
ncbi:MAG: hypothetical protein NBV67_08130 [Tagaea sp.]|nr:hypothetical protein [Tagaea sp.]